MWTWGRSFSSVGGTSDLYGTVSVCFENGIELVVPVITGGFLDELSDLQLRKNVCIQGS